MSSPFVPIISILVLSILSSSYQVQSAQALNQSGTNKSLKHGDEEMESPVGPPQRRYSGSKSQSSLFTPSKGSYYYPVSDPYYDDYYERPGRQFSPRSVSSASYPVMAAAASTQVGFDSEFAASGHGGGHGHGWGWGGGGWGWGGGHGSNSIDNSLGLLGLLGLLSLLSNVLMLITTTGAPAPAPAPAPGRRKRETNPFDDLQLVPETRVGQLCQKILPSLNIIGHVQDKRIPVNCSHQEICTTNKIIVNEFGTQGQAAGSMLSIAIQKMLREVDKSPLQGKDLIQAGQDGREGKDCEKIYPTCEPLVKGKQDLPQLLSPQHVNAIVFKRNPNLVPATG